MRMRIMRKGKLGGSDDIDIAIRKRRIFIADVSTDSRNITVFSKYSSVSVFYVPFLSRSATFQRKHDVH
jgi:hypothetical protein